MISSAAHKEVPVSAVRFEKTGHIATVTLNRPEARNAYSDEMCAQLCASFDRAEQDPQVRAIVLTGAGKAFHAGGDVKAMQARAGMFRGDPAELRQRYLDGIQAVPRRIAALRKPLVCAVNGAAIGAGLDLACMCYTVRIFVRAVHQICVVTSQLND